MKTQIQCVTCVLLCLAVSSIALAQVRIVDQPSEKPGLLATLAKAVEEPILGNGRLGFYFSVGGLLLAPTGRSNEVELANVSGQASLSGMSDGPIAGSYASLGSNLMPAMTVGYALPILNRQLSIETIIALPFTQKLYAGGTLANKSLGPTVLGSLPTGVPPLGENLGEVTVLPPVLTAVYRFFPEAAVRPYLGLGACMLIVTNAKITNQVLTEVSEPKIDVPSKLGWVLQTGLQVRLHGSLFVFADLKYIGGLDITATVKDVWVRVPEQPIYEKVKIGDNVVHMSVNPIAMHLGVGLEL